MPAVVLLVAMLLMPESPAQLARAGTSDQAAAALAWLRDTTPEQARSPGGACEVSSNHDNSGKMWRTWLLLLLRPRTPGVTWGRGCAAP